MRDAGLLVHAVPGGDEMLLVAIHEAGPAFGHNDDVKVSDMLVPAGAMLRRARRVGLDQLGDDPPAGGVFDAEVAVEEEIAQPVCPPGGVARLVVGEQIGDGLIEHHVAPWRVILRAL